MADTHTRTADFTSGLPAWLSNASVGSGSQSVGSGVLTLTAGTTVGHQGAVIGPTGDNFTSFYCRMYPLRDYAIAAAFVALDASFDGYGLGVGTSSTTPGDAEIRVNRLAGGSLTHPASATYNSTTMRWFRMRIDGSVTRFEYAGDSGLGPGSWTELYNVAHGTDLAAWNPASVQLQIYNYPSTTDMFSLAIEVDGINGPTVAGSGAPPLPRTIRAIQHLLVR